MMSFPLQLLFQVSIERLFNSLPEGILIALFAWAVLKLSPKQNSRTRFAVWFLALLAVAAIPWLDGLTQFRIPAASKYPFASVPSALALPEHWIPSIFFLWLVPVCIGVMRLAIGLWRLHALRRACTPMVAVALEPSLVRIINELNSSKSFASRPVTLATSDCIRVPAALGLWKPMIVLPAWTLREISPSDLSIILRHEFAHLRRWDDWTNLVQKIVRLLFFFHPAVWWIEIRLSIEREMACDDIVVAETANPTGYANCLISLLERSLAGRTWTMAQALVHRAREASLRLARILDHDRPAATQLSKPALASVTAFVVLCLLILPHTPQVVAFDQNSPATAADHQYSAALAQPAITQASFAQRSAVRQPTTRRASAPDSPLIRGRAILQGRLSAPSSESASAPASGSNSPAPQERATLAQDVSPRPVLQDALSPAGTAQILMPTFVDFLDDSAQPTLIFVQATQQFDPGSGTVLWRIQVWHLTVVNPVWKQKAQVPVAHST